jgi:hypothetical protein
MIPSNKTKQCPNLLKAQQLLAICYKLKLQISIFNNDFVALKNALIFHSKTQ